MIEETPKKHYMAWITLAMLDFVTIIRFEDVFYSIPKPRSIRNLFMDFPFDFLLIAIYLDRYPIGPGLQGY